MFEGPQKETESPVRPEQRARGNVVYEETGKNIIQLVQTLESGWLCLNPSSDTNCVTLGKLLN